MAMAAGMGCDADRVAKAERDYDMQTVVVNIARSGMQPIGVPAQVMLIVDCAASLTSLAPAHSYLGLHPHVPLV